MKSGVSGAPAAVSYVSAGPKPPRADQRPIELYIYMIYTRWMVIVLRVGKLKHKVNRRDHSPPHVHVEGGGATVRVNLLTLEVMDASTEFSKSMVRKIVT